MNVWTVNEKEEIHACIKANVHSIITNVPDIVLETYKEYE